MTFQIRTKNLPRVGILLHRFNIKEYNYKCKEDQYFKSIAFLAKFSY